MDPILLIHGYSAESKDTDANSIKSIYGELPERLKAVYGQNAVVDVNVSRYISLEDGITLDDISRAMDHCLREEPKFKHLLTSQPRMHAIVHSTGALVVRNWIRLFSPKPSPIQSIIYLAGANFGSGWAHIGRGQMAKWGRKIFNEGAECGIRVLDALELGSNDTIDLHLRLTQDGSNITTDFDIRESVIIGSEAEAEWFTYPIRYGKEDGSDGVVRVSGADLNFNYVRYCPTEAARKLTWRGLETARKLDLQAGGAPTQYYQIETMSRAWPHGRPRIPLAIPYRCAHTGAGRGIVSGSEVREQVYSLISAALETSPDQWDALATDFEETTAMTYKRVRTEQAADGIRRWIEEPRAQYDRHAQVIVRIFDQDRRPVRDYDVFFDSEEQPGLIPIGKLFEDKHINERSPNTITFYLRTDAFDRGVDDWVARVPKISGCALEISATETATSDVKYVPMRSIFSSDDLVQWIQPHRTTIIDVELLRLPSPNVFRIEKV